MKKKKGKTRLREEEYSPRSKIIDFNIMHFSPNPLRSSRRAHVYKSVRLASDFSTVWIIFARRYSVNFSSTFILVYSAPSQGVFEVKVLYMHVYIIYIFHMYIFFFMMCVISSRSSRTSGSTRLIRFSVSPNYRRESFLRKTRGSAKYGLRESL